MAKIVTMMVMMMINALPLWKAFMCPFCSPFKVYENESDRILCVEDSAGSYLAMLTSLSVLTVVSNARTFQGQNFLVANLLCFVHAYIYAIGQTAAHELCRSWHY